MAATPPACDHADVTALRSKGVVLLGEAAEDDSPLLDLGVSVEAAIAAAHGAGSVAYTQAVRSTVAALRRNAELREQLRSGQLTPAQLVCLTPDALATSAQRSVRTLMAERAAAKATLSGASDEAVPTHEYACPACGSREALKLHVGGVRDISKSETWGSKDARDEALRTSLHCTTCQVRATQAHVRCRPVARVR